MELEVHDGAFHHRFLLRIGEFLYLSSLPLRGIRKGRGQAQPLPVLIAVNDISDSNHHSRLLRRIVYTSLVLLTLSIFNIKGVDEVVVLFSEFELHKNRFVFTLKN